MSNSINYVLKSEVCRLQRGVGEIGGLDKMYGKRLRCVLKTGGEFSATDRSPRGRDAQLKQAIKVLENLKCPIAAVGVSQ